MNGDHAELKTLKEEYLNARRALSRVKSGTRRRERTEYINDLKIELGWNLLDYGKYEQGFALFESLSWRGYGEVKCNGMARALTEMGDYDETRKLLEVGLKKFPKSYALWVAKGAVCDSLGDTFGLLECIEISLQYAPEDDSAALYNKALALIKLGCFGDALPIVDELIERYPDDPRHLAERGSCAQNMGYPRETLQYYQRAMEVWQHNPVIYPGVSIYAGLCNTYLELGMKREAMEIAMEGLRRFPDEDPILYHNAGATFLDMGWRNECVEVLKKGAKKFPEDEEIKEFLKDVEDDMDNPNGGEKPPSLGLLLLMALINKKRRRK